jgi:hypothetical protein
MQPGVAVCVCLVAVAALSAQTPQCTEARELLGAAAWHDKAWGAYLAARCNLRDLTGTIASELEKAAPTAAPAASKASEESWAVQAMLDALIDLDGTADPAVLLALQPNWPAEALILMLRNPKENRESLVSLRANVLTGAAWLAAGNALAASRAPGFARILLGELTPTNTICITDPGETEPHEEEQAAFGGPVDEQLPAGYPPIAVHFLTSKAGPGDSLAAAGPRPVYSHSLVLVPGGKASWERPREEYDYDSLRIAHLAVLAGLSVADVEAAIRPATTVIWRNGSSISVAMTFAVAAQRSAISRLGAALAATGALSEQERSETELEITVNFDDQRTDRSVQIPAPPAEFDAPLR